MVHIYTVTDTIGGTTFRRGLKPMNRNLPIKSFLHLQGPPPGFSIFRRNPKASTNQPTPFPPLSGALTPIVYGAGVSRSTDYPFMQPPPQVCKIWKKDMRLSMAVLVFKHNFL